MDDPCNMRTGHSAVTNISCPGPRISSVRALIGGEEESWHLIGWQGYQCRTLIITFLPGLNIITCLHLSQPGHSNIGSLILANKCQKYSPSLSNVASQQTSCPNSFTRNQQVCDYPGVLSGPVMSCSSCDDVIRVIEWSTFREILVDIRDHYTALSSHISCSSHQDCSQMMNQNVFATSGAHTTTSDWAQLCHKIV